MKKILLLAMAVAAILTNGCATSLYGADEPIFSRTGLEGTTTTATLLQQDGLAVPAVVADGDFGRWDEGKPNPVAVSNSTVWNRFKKNPALIILLAGILVAVLIRAANPKADVKKSDAQIAADQIEYDRIRKKD